MATEREQLEIELGLSTVDAQRQLKEYTSAFDRDYKRLEQINKKTNRKLLQNSKDFYRQKQLFARQEEEAVQIALDNTKKIEKATKKLEAVQRDYYKARDEGDEKAGKAQLAEIRRIEDLIDGYEEATEAARDMVEETKKALDKALNADFEFAINSPNLKAAAEGLGEGISEAFSSASSKDALGIGKGIAKAFTKVSSIGLKKLGGGMAAKGHAMQNKEGAGGLSKMLGGLLKNLGPVLQSLGKFLPILGMVGGGIMALVKLFLDAEAGAKEFQKAVLSTSSTMGFLTKAGDNVGQAADDLGMTLKGVRDAAYDLGNVEWGLNSEDYSSTMAELGTMGYTLDKLKDQAGGTEEGVKNLTMETVQMTAAFARNMGVSLQEVSSLTGEWMGQLGMETRQVKDAFAKMSLEARDSGIAANQFFNILRGMSADMSLFNNRMETAAKILGKLTKVMDPRKAQQFLQSIQSFYKGQDLMSRTRHAVMGGGLEKGGGAAGKIARDDHEMKMKGLAGDLANKEKPIDEAELRAAVAGGMKATTQFLAKNATNLSNGEKEAIIDAAREQEKLATGNVVDLASDIKDLSPIGALKMAQAQSMRIFKKPIEQLSGNERIAAESLMNMTDEMADQFNKLAVSLDLSKMEAAERIEKAGKDPNKLSDEDKSLLKNLGIDITKGGAAQKLRDTDSMKVFENMSKTQQDAINEAGKQTDFAKRTAGFQVSLLQKLEMLVDFMMNAFYNSVMSIVDMLANSFLGNAGKQKEVRLAKDVKERKSATLSKALGDAGGDAYKFVGNVMGSEAYQKVVGAAAKDKGQQEKMLGSASADAKKDALMDAARDPRLKAALEAGAKKKAEDKEFAEKKALEGKNQALVEDYTGDTGPAGSVIHGSENKGKATAEQKAVSIENMSFDELKEFIPEDQMTAVLQKLGWHMDPEDLAKAFPDWEKAAGTAMTPEQTQKAVADGMDQVGQRTANEATTELQKSASNGHSLDVHDHHTEPLLQGILDALVGPPVANDSDEATLEEQESTTASLADIYNVLKIKGIRINQSHLDKDVKKVIADATLESIQEGLFEYYQYQGMSPTDLQTYASTNAISSPADLGKSLATAFWDRAKVATSGGTASPVGISQLLGNPTLAGGAPPAAPAASAAQKVDVEVEVKLALTDDFSKYVRVIAQETYVKNADASNRR